MSPDASRKAAFVTHEGLLQFREMPFGHCNAPGHGGSWTESCPACVGPCLVYLDDVISFGADTSEALLRLTEVLERLSRFWLQLKSKKCTFMQTEVAFLGHIVS